MRAAARAGLMLHGGGAIHALLPGDGVYAEGESYDVDVFCSKSAGRTAHRIAAAVLRGGAAAARVVPARHKGTMSVRLDGVAVADVSATPPGVWPVESRSGALCACPVYLKMSMHLELSRPAVYIERWPKVLSRLTMLYKSYPSCDDLAYSETPSLDPLPAGSEECARLAEAAGCVSVGRLAVRELTGVDILTGFPLDFVLPAAGSRAAEVKAVGERMGLGVAPGPRDGLFDRLSRPHPEGAPDSAPACVARVHVVDSEVCCCEGAGGGRLGSSDLVLSVLYSEYIADEAARPLLSVAIDAVVAAQAREAGAESGAHRRFSPFNPPR